MFSNLLYKGNAVTTAHCTAQDLAIVDRILEPQTIAHFLSFALGQPLPNGTQPSVPRLTEDEIPFIAQANFSPGTDDIPLIDRVMSRIGSETDGTRLCLMGKNIQSLKSRLWEGIAPLSAQRWKEQELHCSRYFDFAIQHLSAVVTVFQYLNQPVVRSNLRKTFNLIYEHWESLDKVLNRHRMEKDLEEISVAGLWTMYMASHFEVMTERAHRWVIGHVDALRAPILQALASYEPLVDIRGLPDPLQMKYLDRLHMLLEVSVAADYSIMIPMDGYKEYTAPKRERPGPEALYATDVLRRNAVYVDRVRALSHQFMLRDAQASGDDWSASQTSGESYRQTGMQQIESQEQARREMRGAPVEPLFQEPWITASLSIIDKAAKRDEVEIHGIVVYRLTYGQTETEWTGFIQKLEAHMLDWGEGQTGSSAIKPHLRLEWLDGKELGIPEGDLEAAKRHFNETAIPNSREDKNSEQKEYLHLQSNAFLVTDAASYASYTTTSYGAATSTVIPGDFSGFLLAVDAKFDSKEGIQRPHESPGYHGQMRVLGSLIWGDLYALLSSQSSRLEDLWPLAKEHPNQVYVGPTVPWQRYFWRRQNAMRQVLLREVVDYAKKKLEIEPAPSSSISVSAPDTGTSETTQNVVDSLDANSEKMMRECFDAALCTHMRGEVKNFLRRSYHPHHIALASELMDFAAGEDPDLERIRQRLDEVDRQLEQRRQDDSSEDGDASEPQ